MPRILLKLSGEALAPEGGEPVGIDPAKLDDLADELIALGRAGGEGALVLGAGNLLRGAALQAAGMDRITGDHMGMLATVMNGLAVKDLLIRKGQPVALFSAFEVPGIAEVYARDRAVAALESGAVVILAGGTGNPLFTTDTAACLRGIEIGADMVLKAPKVDGVYSADPVAHPDAVRYDELTYDEVLDRQLGVMDLTAICLSRDHDMPLVVFDMNTKGALTAIINGDKVGTRIRPG